MTTAGSRVTKAQWRRWATQRRSEISDWDGISRLIVSSLEAWAPIRDCRHVLIYLPMANEVDLRPLLASDLGCRWLATRTPPVGEPLTVHELGGPLEVHRYGYSQPTAAAAQVDPGDLDCVLVPGLAFDVSGNRLGHGAGYYDRLLGRVRNDIPLVGIVPHQLVVEALPTEPHDVAMTHLATQSGVDVVTVGYPPATSRFLEAVADLDVTIDPVVFPNDTKTSQQAADALGCRVSEITKSLVFMADDSPLMVLMAGDRRVDVASVAEAVAAQRVRRASLDEVRAHTGFVAGGTPPFGHLKAMRVLADRSISDNDVVWVAAGSPKAVFAIGVEDLVRLSRAAWVDVAEEV